VDRGKKAQLGSISSTGGAGAIRVVKAFGREAHEQDRFVRQSSQGIGALIRVSLAQSFFSSRRADHRFRDSIRSFHGRATCPDVDLGELL